MPLREDLECETQQEISWLMVTCPEYETMKGFLAPSWLRNVLSSEIGV